MSEMDFSFRIPRRGASSELINEEIIKRLYPKIKKALDTLALIDIDINDSTDEFMISVELVLCSKSDLVIKAEMQANKLATFGLSEDQILEILKIGIQSPEGF